MTKQPYAPPLLRHPIDATVRVPGSKSITNRALLLAALAEGVSHLRGCLDADDPRYFLQALRDLNVPVEVSSDRTSVTITGTGGRFPAEEADLFLGNAGTATRFLCAALTLGQGSYRIDGVARMRERPIQDLLDGLGALGADCTSELATGCPPVRIRATGLDGGVCRLAGNVSSQFLSAVLMVAPLARRDVVIELTSGLVSRPYIDMTIAMMRQFGVEVGEPRTGKFVVECGQRYSATEYDVEPDASSASYFMAAAALTGGRVVLPGLGAVSLQGDTRFADVIAQMGCEVDYRHEGLVIQGKAHMNGVDIDMNEISDTVMTLAAIAPFADSPTTIRNVAHIRVKETDRLAAISTELGRIGVRTEATGSSITVYPGPVRAAQIETYDDHRMAMSFAIAGIRAGGIEILNPGCVAKTFPTFFEVLEEAIASSR